MFNQSDPPPWEEPHKSYAVQVTESVMLRIFVVL